MPWKDIEKQRAAIRRHYYANRQTYIDKAIKRKAKLRKWLNEAKESSPCKDCRKQYPYYVMEFDHLGNKSINVSQLINKNTSFTKLKLEIAKCELVCANCHRIRTYTRRATNDL